MLFSYTLIGLREGLEAGLVVTILIAFLVRTGRRLELVLVRVGVVAALVVSGLAAALLTYTAASMGEREQALFEAVTSLLAVAVVTGIIFWMRHPARALEERLQGQLTEALRMGSVAVFVVSFVAVLREGLEASIFVLVAAQGSETETGGALLSFLAGVVLAVLLTWLLYRGVLRINMTRLFTITGFFLVFVAAGIFGHGVHDLQMTGILPGADASAFDIGGVLPLDTWYGSLLNAAFNVSAKPTIFEITAWAGYLVVILPLFMIALSRSAAAVGQEPAKRLHVQSEPASN